MTGPEDLDMERLALLVRDHAPSASGAGACPEANLLCGFAEGRLAGAEHSGVAGHLAGCESCRVVVAEIGGLQPPSVRPRHPPVWLRLAAAALLVGIAAVLVLGRGTVPTDERLVAAARALAADLPDRFGTFLPLTRDERRAPGGSIDRGGGVPLHPSQRILTTRPSFRWEPEPGASSYAVALRTADGALLWQATTQRNELLFPGEHPDLQAGKRYFWQLRVSGALGTESPAARMFEVADAASRRDLEAALQAIDARSAPELAALLRAHFALRGGFLEQAEAAARAAIAATPRDQVARETMFRVLNVLGATEAERFRPEPEREPR